MTYLLHGLIWTLTYIVIFVLDFWANTVTLYTLGVVGPTASLIAYVVAALLGMYWAHRIAAHVAPLPKKDSR